jgi:membrane-associated HD superfamily phosphohydrolase
MNPLEEYDKRHDKDCLDCANHVTRNKGKLHFCKSSGKILLYPLYLPEKCEEWEAGEEIIEKLADYEDAEEQKEKQFEALQKIADCYGEDAQARQLIEEMAELIVAMQKYDRYCESGEREKAEKWAYNFLEELADVKIMIEQIIYLNKAETAVEKIIQEKIERQLKRIDKRTNGD